MPHRDFGCAATIWMVTTIRRRRLGLAAWRADVVVDAGRRRPGRYANIQRRVFFLAGTMEPDPARDLTEMNNRR
jgi:hypothetical protein